jgi:hypothetical protein
LFITAFIATVPETGVRFNNEVVFNVVVVANLLRFESSEIVVVALVENTVLPVVLECERKVINGDVLALSAEVR